MAFDGVIISNHVDEAFLVEHNAVLTDYLAKGGVIFTLAEKGLPWLTEVANWKRSPIPLKDREARIIATDQKSIEKVEEAGIPTVGVKAIDAAAAEPLATFNSWLKLTSDMKGGDTTDRADKFIKEGTKVQKEIDAKLADVKEKDKPKVLFLFQHNDKSIVVGGANFFSEKWTKATGGIDVAGDSGAQGQKEVNMEQIYKWNPDIIYITNFTQTQPEDLLENKVSGQDWSDVAAVKEGKVYKVPLGIYRWFPPSGDAPLMLKFLAQHNHPDVFDYDMKEEIKTYYKNFYEFDVTDEEVESILHPSSDAAKY